MNVFACASILSLMILTQSSYNFIYAASRLITAEGEYHLGDRDNRETAKKAALAEAKRKISEQAGVYVEGYVEVNNFQVSEEQVKTVTRSIIEIVDEKVEFINNGTVCVAEVTAMVDIDSIKILLSEETNKSSNQRSKKIPGYEELNGHYYKLFDEEVTWKQAIQRCENMGGHLVSITSEQEQSLIQKLLLLKGTKNSYWLGAFRGMNGNWEWITNEPFLYSHWGWNQPDNYAGQEKVIMIYCSEENGWKLGDWNDAIPNGNSPPPTFFGVENYGFICEWDSAEEINQ